MNLACGGQPLEVSNIGCHKDSVFLERQLQHLMVGSGKESSISHANRVDPVLLPKHMCNLGRQVFIKK